jgi:hypothetical protein
MKRLILLLTTGLTVAGALGAAVFFVTRVSRTGPNIEDTPVYPGAADFQIHSWNTRFPIYTMQAGTDFWSSSQSASNSGSVTFEKGYAGMITFGTAARPEQVYEYYEGMLTRAGWRSLIADGIQEAPRNSTSGVGLSGPRIYWHDPAPLWLKRLIGGNIGGVVTSMTVQAHATSSTGGSDVTIVLYRD